MIKYFLLLFNVLGLLFYKSFFETDPVTISHNFPTSVGAGLEYVVEIKIKKSNITGFAELRQTLPVGFDASVIDCKKGSFSFSDREVKIIWMTIPEEQEFTVQYKITVLSNAASEGVVDGTFSYLDNNQKTSVNLEQKQVKVNLAGVRADQAGDLARGFSESISEMNLPVLCARNVNNIYGPGKFLVEVTIQNDSISGFAKLEELIPIGFTASAMQTQNAVFSFVDQKAKFLWMSFPFEKEFKVSYVLTANEEAVDSTAITGFLSFTLAEVSKKFTLGISPISLTANKTYDPNLNPAATDSLQKKPQAQTEIGTIAQIAPQTEVAKTEIGTIAQIAPQTEVAKTEIGQTEVEQTEVAKTEIAQTEATKTEVAQTEIAQREKIEAEKEVINNETNSQTIAEAAAKNENDSKSNAPLGKANETLTTVQSGVSFRVQICATKKPVELNYFKNAYQLNDEIYAEMHEGWHKFTLNTVDTYRLARDKREELKQNQQINGPFVTAYNSGSRITVQEALMIANQKWVR
jgi:hypothetical protein